MIRAAQHSMASSTILVVEDDDAIRQGVVDALKFSGFNTLEAARGDDGLRMAIEVDYDLLLLDLMLPEIDGLQILQDVRQTKPTIPVIILTARGKEDDRVNGLRAGADDYVVKPFSAKELLARVEAVLRRSPERPSDLSAIQLVHGVIDLARREMRFKNGTQHELSEREVELLRYLAGNSGRAIARDELLQRVWGMDPRGLSTRTIDMHVARLRDKIEVDPASPSVIQTVRGKGYKFTGTAVNS